MKRWIAVLGAAVLALSLAVSATAADTQPGKRKGGGVKRVENALAQLNLTTEQKPKVDKLVTDTKAELKTIRTSTGTPEDKKAKNRAAMRSFRDKLNGILTDEQEAKLKELLPKRKPGAKKPKA